MRRVSVALLALASHTFVFATPAEVYDGKVFSNATSSPVLRDLTDPNRLWVLPPTVGKRGTQFPQLVVTRTQCELIVTEQQDIADLYKELRSLRKQQSDALASVDQTASNADTATATTMKKYKQLSDLAAADQAQIERFQVKQGNLFGGNLQLVYDTEWKSNVAAVRASNPSFPIVEAVATKDLKMFFSIPGSVQDGFTAEQMPIIMNYTVQGFDAKKAESTGLGMSDKLAVDLSLTQMGACVMQFPTLFGSNLQPTFALSAQYTYPRSYSSKISATYNLLSIYKYLQSSGTSGGLFTSKSWSDTVESNWGASAFKMNWTEADPDNKVTLEQRSEAERTIKADLLANINVLVAAQLGIAPTTAVNPGPHGATVIADGLEKNCSFNAYCVAGAVALRALDAIFGSSSSRTSYEKKIDVTATYQMSSDIARYVTGGTNFVAQ